MNTNPTTEQVSTDQLAFGDVVLNHGMRLVIDRPIETNDTAHSPVFRTSARIDNWDELIAEAAAETADRIINGAAQFITHRASSDNGEHRWTIQGNALACWWREADSPVSRHGWCHQCGHAYKGLYRPVCECAGDPPIGFRRNPLDPSFREHAERVQGLRYMPTTP